MSATNLEVTIRAVERASVLLWEVMRATGCCFECGSYWKDQRQNRIYANGSARRLLCNSCAVEGCCVFG